ncbi:MAG: hypothetical protein DLM67_12770 [Candidatus Nephthysia bennettiae]|uniref:SPW repeat protein n=1 Tax=Candidatus Nephthysia bennettiae TaxID=3127016 RepID=A0A934K5B8_9BACT|nr:SPW repeat protein [Candidatus Dormibacteraeota bacterium]PZR94222.1 MAG: hypothetical protein DLM67_12770 [Candidatus Dormibacteraeota bacterium]
METVRFLPTKVHGVLDYLVGIALILAPNIFQFSGMGVAAAWIPRVLGVVLILYSLFTNYEWGVFKVVGMPYHLVIDFLAALFLAASPFIFGFFRDSPNVWLPHLVVGIAVILVVIVSQTQPGRALRTTTA